MDAEDTEGLARGRAWDLFADVFEHGPDRRREHLLTITALADCVPDPDDEAEAWSHRLFSQEVQPFASAFLEPSRCLGGAVSQGLWDAVPEGLEPSLEPDHLAIQLRVMARLHDQPERAAAFASTQLLPWLPPLVVAVNELDAGFYGRTLALVQELAASQAGSEIPDRLAPLEHPLENPRTGLRDIADWLVTPARSGVWLSHTVLARIGRHLSLPRGFGSRSRVLENLLQAAAHRECIPALVAALSEHLKGVQERVGMLAGGAVWSERIGHTHTEIQGLKP